MNFLIFRMSQKNKDENVRFSPTFEPEELKEMKIEMFGDFQKNHPHLPIMIKGKLTHTEVKPVLSLLPAPKKPEKHTSVNLNLSRKEMAQVTEKIGELPVSVICGTVFGDTSLGINNKFKQARMQNKHSTRQQAWFFWKWMVALRQFHQGISSITLQNATEKQKKSPLLPDETFLGCLKVSSGAREELTELKDIICTGKDDKKKIERSWLNHMTNYFLMVLWIDDGGLHSGNSQGRISCNSTPVDEQQILVDYLDTVWNVKGKIAKQADKPMANGEYAYAIELVDTENLLILLRIIAPLIPIREMLYKVQFVPKSNTSLLQRWASEVTELVQPQFRDEMKAFYSKTLEKYNR